MSYTHILGAILRSHGHVLLASAASLAALAGILLVPAAASASASGQAGTDTVTITGSFAQSSVNAGSTDKLSGVASYVSAGSPQPLANTTLSITSPSSFNWPAISATVTTAADGSFSYVTPEIPLAVSSVAFTVSSAATTNLDAGQLSLTLPVNQAAQVSFFTGTISVHRVLQFSACGGIPEPEADSPLVGPLEYQYSRTAHGPWKALGNGTRTNVSCEGSLGGTYPGKFTAPLTNAYYRAYAPAVPGQMSAASKVIHLRRNSTRITDFSITPRRVRRGGKVTVSGLLWQQNGRWRRDARQLVVIEYQYKNKTYTLKHRLTTNSSGRFRGVFAVPRTAAWLAVYNGSKTEFATASKAIAIRVR
jgi:hypothetical protein